MSFDLHMLNGKKKNKKASKKGTRRAPAKKQMAKKKAAKKARRPAGRCNNPMHNTKVHTPKKYKRRAGKKKAGHKKHRRRNPSGRALLSKLRAHLPTGKDVAGAAIGVVATSAATKFFADGTPLFPGSGPTSIAGEPWNIKQYAAAGAVAVVVPAIADKLIPGSGRAVGATVVAIAIAKTVMPLVAKVPMINRYLGEAEGEIKVDDDGQSWIMQGGRWNALQGNDYDYEGINGLVPATALDGYSGMSGLVPASPLDAVPERGIPIRRQEDFDLNRAWNM
jgi:hypothetical protein